MFLQGRLNNEPMTIRGDGEQRRDFTHVKDIAKANLLAMTSEKVGAGEVINIGNSDNRSVNQIAAMIGGPTVTVDPVVEPRETLANNSKAKNLLGWSPSVIIEEWVPKYKRFRNIMSKKILITGGAGFIAHHVIDKILSTTDWEIITLDRLDFSGNLNRLNEVVTSYDEHERKRVR